MLAALLCMTVSVILTLPWLMGRFGGDALVATFATAGITLIVAPIAMGVLDGQWTAAAFEAVPLAAVLALLYSLRRASGGVSGR